MKRASCRAMLSFLLAACGERETGLPAGAQISAQVGAQVSAQVTDAARGRIALTQYACHACHVIPGITGSDVYVGPPLAGLAKRPMIAGSIPNTPENLVAWIRHPQALDPATAMPDMGVREQDARDMAAYLSTLK